MGPLRKPRLTVSIITVLFAMLALSSCKPKCYDCIVTNPDSQQKDTINTLCTDQAQYTASYLESWKVFCASSHGETVVREKD